MRKARRQFIDDQCGRNKEENRRQHPQADRRRAVVRGRGNVEKQNVPKTQRLGQLFDRIGSAARRLAHRVTSIAGIRASCMRKLWINGSVEFSKSSHGPKNATRPSWRKTTVSASFFARCVSCVTTMDVR